MILIDVFIDNNGRLWQNDTWEGKYKCLSVPTLEHKGLEELHEAFGPLYTLSKSTVPVPPPYKPIDDGEWVEFDPSKLQDPALGRVKSYDNEKFFYEIVVNIPRHLVRKSP